MLNMESPQMYDTVQTLTQLDLKKQPPPQQAIIGQITLTAMSSQQQQQQQQQQQNGQQQQQQQQQQQNDNNNNNTQQQQQQVNGVGVVGAVGAGLVVKQHAMHQMHQAAAMNNNNNNNSVLNANVNNVNLLQKQIMQQYTQSDLDELTAQEISLDLQHLIDDSFRDQETLGIFSDMVTSPGVLSATLPPNGMVTAAAKVLQQHQLQQQSLRTQQHQYGRNPLAYMPQAVHSNASYSNNSSDENSSVGSDTSTIKEEPIDPEYRRHLQETNAANNAAAAAFISNGSANGLYNPYQNANGNGNSNNSSSQNSNNFNTLTSANVLAHHSAVNLPHLAAGAHLLKHHNKQVHQQRKQSLKHVDKGTEEYRRRRERNNIAVRKSREKAKVRSREVEERVKSLLKEKDALLRQLQEMTNELQLHKQIYMQLINHNNPEVSRVCRSFLNTNDHGL
ncbi:CCAAT/enhancer-binding protein [Lucilia sericata]|uniref:CCAAT/enhancer-binding protein n=1 Tax=Lucilia sericata TaxID=13632 RepID=UPI0018A864BC|nr:CCAAT/enhancer-binding protein [Lucilia sericata]XP_037822201.1 CCAAT/enhancer-binding protein [Lucilia sericata]XP_037822202.1 CCAAT/enhancer-binding protein [Lucilia sericata]